MNPKTKLIDFIYQAATGSKRIRNEFHIFMQEACMSVITLKDFDHWLRRYGDAWEKGDPSATRILFTDDARYYENPFEDPMAGLDEIYKYWKDNALSGQKEVHFSHEVLAIEKNVGVAHWHANFIRLSSGNRVTLDGIFKVGFSKDGKCQIFREWWHRIEETPFD